MFILILTQIGSQTICFKMFAQWDAGRTKQILQNNIVYFGFFFTVICVRHDPACVLIKIVKRPDGNINSADAWMTHAGDGSNCREDYSLQASF